jgi:hypothetical protein
MNLQIIILGYGGVGCGLVHNCQCFRVIFCLCLWGLYLFTKLHGIISWKNDCNGDCHENLNSHVTFFIEDFFLV